ncbi:hypothetical protein SAMN04488134_106189 [Amphibacillus marinus]|uniref:Membrane protein NfeD2 N-terminal transmembrane domain-containing protein n=1 Tax=Amphibacillus marinus TaxID=872970 RepID=A0A1H8P337_9BACI|nr:NfeD family protein [Amphibacillus marinus]SEO36204.1 hypothetical protein SAMN04488134_106189 [Amphibacillus marinus]
MDIQTIYLYGLIIGGIITILYMLIGDVFEAIGEITVGSILNPTVVLSFISVLCGAGYIMELRETLDSLSIFVLATLISLVIVSLLHFFILVPLAKSEQSTAFSIVDFIGKEGEVITTIPVNGLGEVLIKSGLGSTGNIAKCASNTEISQGSSILVLEIDQDGVLIVEPVFLKKITH